MARYTTRAFSAVSRYGRLGQIFARKRGLGWVAWAVQPSATYVLMLDFDNVLRSEVEVVRQTLKGVFSHTMSKVACSSITFEDERQLDMNASPLPHDRTNAFSLIRLP